MIAARGIGKAYAGAVVLEDVSLDVTPGSAMSLLGPNGAGKTTLLRILATLARPTAGALRLNGVDALASPERARTVLGMVGHGSQVYDELTAVENLRFWTTLAGRPASPDTLRGALRQVELEGVADERARTFSAGMKRRLALARVLLAGVELLLLDEPFSGLDRQGRKWLGGFLADFKAGGGTVVLATHVVGAELGAVDRIGILAGGRLVLDRPLGELRWDEVPALYDSLTEGLA